MSALPGQGQGRPHGHGTASTLEWLRADMSCTRAQPQVLPMHAAGRAAPFVAGIERHSAAGARSVKRLDFEAGVSRSGARASKSHAP